MHERIICMWLRKAEKDLKWAEAMLLERDLDYSTFHSQQAAEKALKAVITALKIQPPKTHDIEKLLNILDKNNVYTSLLEKERIGELTKYAVEARYPDFEEEPSEEEAVEALELAGKTVDWAREKLRELEVEC